MKEKKLIRGVIYDNPEASEQRAFETAALLSAVVDDMCLGQESYYDTNMHGYDIPNREEYYASVLTSAICRPTPVDENLIIPASLIDDKLYKELKKIDISDQILEAFMGIRYDLYDQSQNQKVVISFRNKDTHDIREFEFDSKEEAVNAILNMDLPAELGTKHKFSRKQLEDIVNTIIAA